MKSPTYIQTELKRSKGGCGTKHRHNTELGLHTNDYETRTEYQRELSAKKKYEEIKAKNEFVAEQVNGTIFAHEGCEGGIL